MKSTPPAPLRPTDAEELGETEPMIGADRERLTVYNTLNRKKEKFSPLNPGKVSMYVCGVTTYDLAHIGHARTFVSFDVITRYLRALGFDLKLVRNHTDVDDKIIARALETDRDAIELAHHFIGELDRDMGLLGVRHADVEPKVSEHIAEIIALVGRLVDNGKAYAAANGDVFFRVGEFAEYGKLSGQRLDELRVGSRIEVDPNKESPFDFALWKSAKPGEPMWDSPWGQGRPGWHIECSAMAMTHLGDTIDIHAGGSDLIFPHHENEIAQSEGATDATFARYWLHGGMVNVLKDGEVAEKMSKSLGNFWTVRDVLQVYPAEVVRYFFLTTHYRQPITYSHQMMEEAFGRLEYLYTTLQRINEALSRVDGIPDGGNFASPAAAPLSSFFDSFHAAMSDDFNFPAALVPIGELAKASNELTKSPKKPKPDIAYTLGAVRSALVQAGQVLGILQRFPAEVLRELRDKRAAAMEIDSAAVEARIDARFDARKDKNWALADEIRGELSAMGIELMDGPDGTDWRIGKMS